MKTQTDTASTLDQNEITRLVAVARDQGEPDNYAGKRGWKRYCLGMRLEVTTDVTHASEVWSVTMHNVSGGGFGFWSKRKIAGNTPILVRECPDGEPRMWLSGCVKHCTKGLRGFLIGAVFDHPIPADPAPNAKALARKLKGRASPVPSRPPTSLHSLGTKCACASAAACGIAASAAYAIGADPDVPVMLGVIPIVVGLCALILGALGGRVAVWRELRFLRSFRAAIRDLATQNASTAQLPEAPSKELAALRNTFLDLSKRWNQRAHDERQQRQKLQEVNQIKSNILAIVSHDLRTPLTSILLYAQMLTDELDTLSEEDKRKFLGIVSEECTRLSRLVDDLLEVQRLEAGRVQWDMRTQDLAAIIRSCAQVFEAFALSKAITLTIDCPPSLPPVEADADKISQVLSNLLSNALKYSPSEGKVTLSAWARGNEIMLRVADTGPGIPREKWDHIFDRFTQLSDPNVREIAGFGLGLNIVKKIIEAHGGAVWCDSEVGQGSEFYVSLPTMTATARTEIEPAIPPPARRVLVCDADPELAAAVAQTLRWKKFDVRVLHSGCSLLAQLEQGDADVVVTDVLLPDMNAADLLNALNTMPERSFRLVVHSYAGEAQELTRRYGVDVFLRRPVSREELLKAVNIAMNKRFSSGLSIVVVRSDSLDMTPVITLLSHSGHTPMVTESVESAAAMTHDYATDVVLVPAGTLNNNWAELDTLRTGGNDERMRIIVLCDALRKKERRLAEEHGVLAVTYRPGQPEELKAAIRPSEETVLVESTQ